MMAAARDLPVQGELRYDEPMSRHTSWRAGGPAEVFFVPASVEDLAAFLAGLDAGTPIFWHGVGSNLLVRDGGISGVVVSATRILRDVERADRYLVRAGAGLPCTQLARQCIRWELGPSEFFAGIPGTVGGALAMNAGAHGGETWERVESVRTIDRGGEIHERAERDEAGTQDDGRSHARASAPHRSRGLSAAGQEPVGSHDHDPCAIW